MLLWHGQLVLRMHYILVIASPNQLVFGKNHSFPSNLTNKPPAMEELTHSQLVLKNLNPMHAARMAIIEAESNSIEH